jgi:hypothetical protein
MLSGQALDLYRGIGARIGRHYASNPGKLHVIRIFRQSDIGKTDGNYGASGRNRCAN